jgi:DNA polymerase III delta subunit
MIYFFLGPDQFSKEQAIQQVQAKHGRSLERHPSGEVPRLDQLFGGDLFAAPAIHVLQDAFGAIIDIEALLEQGKQDNNILIWLEEKLDKRKKEVKTLLADARLDIKEFETPTGAALDTWIDAQAKKLGLSLSTSHRNLVRDRIVGPPVTGFGQEINYSLWDIYHELEKLSLWSGGEPLTDEAITSLIPESFDTPAWDIVNAIADKRTHDAFQYLQRFLNTDDGTDQKAKTIQLAALLSDQFRSIALVQAARREQIPDATILADIGWKSGRLFIMKKIAAKFDEVKILNVLQKLAHFDIEVKSTQTPAVTLLELIIAQAL